MIITDKRYENTLMCELLQSGDIFVYNDIEKRQRHYCIATECGAIDLQTGKIKAIDAFGNVEKVQTELIIRR